ncbi:uncharacterized protein MELLADRAFT_66970 [Melampsora larici-populina 98AG31]|uniref:OTU domain-containing protein n=1 Tax=Melampsora larici-populina (strain 98AG31 / pathotype 3-4-7) TaxID=747676 RepID=F4S1B5_MELLP|nr:uncharacterized protein MELLADRAFT_66970 [Melampsora larici-populina 98AG31]EGG01534.1 hypothetical protein MELLADRAFT_66970 [Melampsora larici-populina 98AG31]
MTTAHCKLRRLLFEFLLYYSLCVYSTPHPMPIFRINERIPSSVDYWVMGGQHVSHPLDPTSVMWPQSAATYNKPDFPRMNQRNTPGILPLHYQASTEQITAPALKLRPNATDYLEISQTIQSLRAPVKLYASEDLYSQANKDLLRYNLQDMAFDSSRNAPTLQAIKPPGLKDFAVTNFIKGDGNCQFYAVSMLLHGTTDFHEELRAHAVAHMESNKERYVHFIDFDQHHSKSWEEYCTRMTQDKEYGDQLTLQALARVYQRNFVVLSDSESHDSVLVYPVRHDSKANDMPYLPLYLNQLHYEIVLKDHGTSNIKEQNSNLLTNSEIGDQPSSTALIPATQNELQASETGGAVVALGRADDPSDWDGVPLLDHTEPLTDHQNPTNQIYPAFYGARLPGQGTTTGRNSGSRLRDWLTRFRLRLRSIWKRVLSIFRRHRKQR